MKFLKPLLAVGVLSLFFFSSTTMSSCVKETIIRDTLIKKDTIIVTDTIPCTDLKAGLVAWYKFTGGSLKDSSGNNNHIVFSNATATTDRFGRANNAFLFNGNGNYMKVNNSPSLNPTRISIVGIVKLNGFYMDTYGANQILKKGMTDQTDGIYGLRILPQSYIGSLPDTTKEFAYGYYGNNDYSRINASSTNTFINTNQWRVFVFTYNGIDAKFYVDGVLKETITGVVPFTPNADGLFIGRAENPLYPYWLKGVVDEIRIYDRALCDCDVKELNKLKN
jgi:hypothetical protein